MFYRNKEEEKAKKQVSSTPYSSIEIYFFHCSSLFVMNKDNAGFSQSHDVSLVAVDELHLKLSRYLYHRIALGGYQVKPLKFFEAVLMLIHVRGRGAS